MTHRRLLGLLLATLLTVALLGASPARASGSTAPDPDPETPFAKATPPNNDFPHLPARCAVRKDLIPLTPVRCNLNKFVKSRPTIVLWGDSHAWQLVPALRDQAAGRGVNLVAYLLGSCPVMVKPMTKAERRKAPDCLKSNAMALDFVKKLRRDDRDVRVVLATFWQRYLHAIRKQTFGSYYGQMAKIFEKSGPRAFRILGRMRVGVDVVGQALTVPARAPNCRKGNDPYKCNLPRFKAIREEKGTRAWVKARMRPLARPSYVDINKMCTRRTCYAKVQRTNTFFDVFHITASMSRLISYVFAGTVDRALAGAGSRADDGPSCSLPILCP
ncbi:MAG TPA: SGNH hydrolase domain-containing protein [Nocardioides sp.]|nr:SGNH hydrolase domain-containing protein [Nocardioides sp.]